MPVSETVVGSSFEEQYHKPLAETVPMQEEDWPIKKILHLRTIKNPLMEDIQRLSFDHCEIY